MVMHEGATAEATAKAAQLERMEEARAVALDKAQTAFGEGDRDTATSWVGKVEVLDAKMKEGKVELLQLRQVRTSFPSAT